MLEMLLTILSSATLAQALFTVCSGCNENAAAFEQLSTDLIGKPDLIWTALFLLIVLIIIPLE